MFWRLQDPSAVPSVLFFFLVSILLSHFLKSETGQTSHQMLISGSISAASKVPQKEVCVFHIIHNLSVMTLNTLQIWGGPSWLPSVGDAGTEKHVLPNFPVFCPSVPHFSLGGPWLVLLASQLPCGHRASSRSFCSAVEAALDRTVQPRVVCGVLEALCSHDCSLFVVAFSRGRIFLNPHVC